MGFFGNLIGTLVDIKKLSNLSKALEPEIEALKAQGKCPEELKDAANFLKNLDGGGTASGVSKELEEFLQLLEKHSDLFSDDLRSKFPKMMEVAKDLEKRANSIEADSK